MLSLLYYKIRRQIDGHYYKSLLSRNKRKRKKFAEEMISSGIVKKIRNEEGNLRYEYFFPMEDPQTVLLIDSWKDQHALDVHHASSMMTEIIALRNKYDLHMTVERYLSDEADASSDHAFIRK